jgi:hypothetical protein
MRLRDVIRASKTITDKGKWTQGKMPKSAFFVAKNKGYTLGSKWHWRVVTFQALEQNFRLRIAVDLHKENYEAILGLEDKAGDMLVLARLEYHSTHDAWHAHTRCGDVTLLTKGILGGNSFRRLRARDKKFGVTLLNAEGPAARYFKLFKGFSGGGGLDV